ncbi:hypothetical protein HGRIS_012677 [Hohenbuehelia grisea]|uniref:Uncharacterized protein n=1 Tax=Hohenbuehelia grisea TaxID=104357 RepID=A0ABR3IT64_9AGAR
MPLNSIIPRPASSHGTPSRPLHLDIPRRPSTSSSADSPLESSSSSTPSILTLSSSAQSPSGTPLSVQFAPLPDLSKRKKRYHQPLGVAARSEMMRRRRGNMNADEPDNGRFQREHGHRASGERGRYRYQRQRTVMGDVEDEDEDESGEDPLLVLGRMVKGAGKSLWRKVAQKKAGQEGKNGDGEGSPQMEDQNEEKKDQVDVSAMDSADVTLSPTSSDSAASSPATVIVDSAPSSPNTPVAPRRSNSLTASIKRRRSDSAGSFAARAT